MCIFVQIKKKKTLLVIGNFGSGKHCNVYFVNRTKVLFYRKSYELVFLQWTTMFIVINKGLFVVIFNFYSKVKNQTTFKNTVEDQIHLVNLKEENKINVNRGIIPYCCYYKIKSYYIVVSFSFGIKVFSRV